MLGLKNLAFDNHPLKSVTYVVVGTPYVQDQDKIARAQKFDSKLRHFSKPLKGKKFLHFQTTVVIMNKKNNICSLVIHSSPFA